LIGNYLLPNILILTSFVILRGICYLVLRVANEMDVYICASEKKALEAVAEVIGKG
jgi:hypothetical protein